jgi:hypothetical protein
MKHAICECCEEPVLDLVEMEGISVIETESRDAAAIRLAPRRPARWCLGCARAHETWKARQRRAAEARPAPAPGAPMEQLGLPGL